ncbi:MAG: hypothetical protein ACR2P5_05475 [Gammaproteobacteria bacterium]
MSDPRLLLTVVCVGLIVVLIYSRASWSALAALVCLVISTGFFNLWTMVEVPAREEDAGAHMDALTWAYDLWAFGLNAVLVMYAGVLTAHLWWPRAATTLARLLWSVVLVAEGYSLIFENFNCNILNRGLPGYELSQVWGSEVSIYACARRYGEVIVWSPTLVEVAFLVWIVWRYSGWNLTRPRGSTS